MSSVSGKDFREHRVTELVLKDAGAESLILPVSLEF